MPSFTTWNHQISDLFFRLWVLFWNLVRIFSMQNIKSNCYIIFFQICNYIFFIKDLTFFIISWCFPIFPCFNATAETCWKHFLLFSLIKFIIVFCLLWIRKTLYMIHHDSHSFYYIFNTTNSIIKEKIAAFHECF